LELLYAFDFVAGPGKRGEVMDCSQTVGGWVTLAGDHERTSRNSKPASVRRERRWHRTPTTLGDTRRRQHTVQ